MKIPATRILVKKEGKIDRSMTRSAPPARPNRPQTTVSLFQRSRPKTATISISDIYQLAERERLNYSAKSRRQNLEHAQSQFQFFRTDSRPHTSASRYLNYSERDTQTPMGAWTEPSLSRPPSMVANREIAEFEADDDDSEEEYTPRISVVMSAVSRDCCEIIGPQTCQECRKNRIRDIDRKRSESFFPTIQPSADNLTATAIVKKYIPRLSYAEIEDRIARGEIAKPAFLKSRDQTRNDDVQVKAEKRVAIVDKKEDTEEERLEKKRQLLNKRRLETAALYFSNIRELNMKIVTGQVTKSLNTPKSEERASRQTSMSSSEDKVQKSMFPMFISPRNVNLEEQPKYKAYYEPPLVPKQSQNPEPSFFAGSKQSYNLPEKLPDELVFVDSKGNKIKSVRRFSTRLAMYSDSNAIQEEPEEEAPASQARRETIHE